MDRPNLQWALENKNYEMLRIYFYFLKLSFSNSLFCDFPLDSDKDPLTMRYIFGQLHRYLCRMLEMKCVGDNFEMSLTHLRCWWLIQYIVKVTNITKKSPILFSVSHILKLSPSQRHQHLMWISCKKKCAILYDGIHQSGAVETIPVGEFEHGKNTNANGRVSMVLGDRSESIYVYPVKALDF